MEENKRDLKVSSNKFEKQSLEHLFWPLNLV